MVVYLIVGHTKFMVVYPEVGYTRFMVVYPITRYTGVISVSVVCGAPFYKINRFDMFVIVLLPDISILSCIF